MTVRWLLSKIANSSNVICNQRGTAAVAKLCTKDTDEHQENCLEAMDVDMSSAVPPKVGV